MPYGLYKGVTSGAYGTPEAPRIAAREAQQFMERNTYQPRGEQGQENLRQLAGLLEASKLPPVMPELSLLAAIPKQAYAAQAERTGMAAERALAPVVTRTMERGGRPAQLLQDLGQGSMSPLDVYHGTPYKFDKFDASRIGTGEGAQVYGRGLYFAENPAVAKQYADNVKDISSIKSMNEELSRLVKVMDADSAGGYRKFKSNVGEEAAQQYDDLINRRNSVSTAEGNLYKADLPDEQIAKMLDYDKPLSEQSQSIQNFAFKNAKLLKKELQIYQSNPLNKKSPKTIYDLSGAEVMSVLNRAGDPTKTAEFMRQAGIPGIKYLDQNSRQPGIASMTQDQLDTRIAILKKDIDSGLGNQDRMKEILSALEAERALHTNLTRNFVVFPGEEQSMTILERNNKPMRSLLD
jgi:hypothetical protein